jgi:hypothetical protein
MTPGTCVVVAGRKDAGGQVTASTVNITDPTGGICSGGTGGRASNPARTPNPTASPLPQAAGVGMVRGQVTSAGVSGMSVAVTPLGGGAAVTITVPITAHISRSTPASASALATGECIQAQGTRNIAGALVARIINIVPAGPSGCPAALGVGGRRLGP